MTGVSRLLHAITERLEAADIAYMIVGSYASMVHGEPRTTMDLDIVIDPSRSALEQFLASIDPDGYYVDEDTARDALARRGMFNIIDSTSGWKADLVIRKDRSFSVVELERRTVQRIVDRDVPTASAEDTILAKLEWARDGSSHRQLGDVAGIVRMSGSALDREYLERWLDVLDVRQQWDEALQLV